MSIGPRTSTTSSPRGISRGRFLTFFQVWLLHNTHPMAKAAAPPNPGKPLFQRVRVWLQGPPSPHRGALHRHLQPGMWLRFSSIPGFCRYSTPPEPRANQPFHDPKQGHAAVERALTAPAPKEEPGPVVSPLGVAFIPQTECF